MADNKVGKKTGKKTTAGRDVYETPEGESVSEKSVTIKFGENAYVNAPSIHDGVQYDEEEIRQMLLDGKIKPTSRHDTLEEALEAAKSRSALLMNQGGMSTDEQMKMLGDVELRSDLEPFISNDPLARLGYELYRRNIINVDAMVFDQGKALGNASENTVTQGQFSPSGKTSFNKYLSKQKNIDENIEKPRVVYSAGRDESFRPRGRSMNTLAHEFRHAAISYLENEKGYKLPLEDEEDLTSYLDALRVQDKNYFTKDIEADTLDKKAYKQKDKIEPVYEEISSIANEELKNLQVPEEQQQKQEEKGFLKKLFSFNEGGMAIEKQMELFEDGGLMQEGGTVDPVSGNDVPVGSTQEEVRDDIPAQLSEGEFVFPADVVRFYGLEKLMEMRQRAKAGLRMMEDMGQMGNSEEATLPDDIPFDLEDLDIEDEDEYNNEMEMQVGGFVQPQGFTGIQTTQPSQFQNYQPQYVPYQAPVVTAAYQPAQQQAVPTFTGQIPQAQDFLKTPQPGEQDLRKYVNDEGQVRMIPFVNDQPIYPIPQGFYPEAEKPVEEQAPTAVTTETTRVTDRGGKDSDVSKYGGATISLGGQSKNGLIQGGKTYGLMFDDFTKGVLTNMGILGLGKTLLGKEPMNLPDGTSATIVDRETGAKVSVPSSVYNDMRNNLTGATAKEVASIIEKVNDFKSVGATNEDLNTAYANEQARNLENALAVREAQKTGNFDKVIDKAIKDAEAMIAADDDEAFSSVPASGEGYTGRSDQFGGGGPASEKDGYSGSGIGAGVGSTAGSKQGGPGSFNKGGVATKKMKRGGLASKK